MSCWRFSVAGRFIRSTSRSADSIARPGKTNSWRCCPIWNGACRRRSIRSRWLLVSTSPIGRWTTTAFRVKHPDEFPMNEGRRLVDQRAGHRRGGVRTALRRAALAAQHGTAQRDAAGGMTSYLVGPLARVNLCFDQLSPSAQREAEQLRHRSGRRRTISTASPRGPSS